MKIKPFPSPYYHSNYSKGWPDTTQLGFHQGPVELNDKKGGALEERKKKEQAVNEPTRRSQRPGCGFQGLGVG